MSMNYDAGLGIDKNWIVEETSFDPRVQGKCEAIMCLGNGYIGSRSATEESYFGQVRNTFIANTFNRFHETEVTELPNVADVWGIRITIDGVRFSLEDGVTHAYRRRLNLRTGELSREIEWESPAGKGFKIEFRRFISLVSLHLASQQLRISCDQPSRIGVSSGVDGQQSNSGTQHFVEGEKRIHDHRFIESLQQTTESGIDIVVVASHKHSLEGKEAGVDTRMRIERRQAWIDYEFELPANETLHFEKQAVFVTSRDVEHGAGDVLQTLRERALSIARSSAEVDYQTSLLRSAACWEDYWNSVSVNIEGDDFAQLAIRFAQYHLRVFTPFHDSRSGIAAKGLSGEGYKGHSFWDSEIFCLPFFIYSAPEVARQLLEYRYLTINGARLKAKDNGYQGAMYPWESADTGEEVTPVWGAVDIHTGKATKIWSGFIEQHITADIAYSIWTYFRVTGDQKFMDDMGYEMLFETATFWTSRLEWLDDRSQWGILNVIGPDEYKEHVDNNAFTNYLAEHNVRLAIQYFEELEATRPELIDRYEQRFPLKENYRFWLSRVKQIYLPAPRSADGVIPQDDTYLNKKLIDLSKYKRQTHVGSIFADFNLEEINNIQVTKQADIMALFLLLRHRFTDDQLLANWNYYEPKTLHDSSLSLSSHVLLASQVGDLELATELFQRAAHIDLGPNMKTSDHGIHAASIGGIWQCVVGGFGGLRAVGNELHIKPALPRAWKKLSYPFYWQGQRLRAHITPETTEVVAEHIERDTAIIVNGETVELHAEQGAVANG